MSFMLERDIDIGCVTETKSCGTDYSTGDWMWLKGTEKVPGLGQQPHSGMGALVRRSRFPNASVIVDSDYASWISLDGVTANLMVSNVYIPCYPTWKGDSALAALKEDIRKFGDKGLLVVGGDFNARTSANGDAVTNAAGRDLLNFCEETELTVVNHTNVARGCHSRSLDKRLADGTTRTENTTIDYVLIPNKEFPRVRSLEIVADSDLASDHRPLVIKLQWRVAHQDQTKSPELHYKWKTDELGFESTNAFEGLCENEVVDWLASVEDIAESLSDPQAKVDALQQTAVQALTNAARDAVGRKRVGRASKPWFDEDIAKLVAMRRNLLVQVRSMEPHKAKKARERLVVVRSAIRRRVRNERKKRVNRFCRDLESSSNAKLFWSHWNQRKACNETSDIPAVALDEEGDMVSDPVKVIKVWRDFIEKLGRPDRGLDSSDRISQADPNFDNDFADQVLEQLKLFSNEDGVVPELDRQITWDEVWAAIAGLPHGKAAGLDTMTAELLQRAGIAYLVALATLFNIIWKEGEWPTNWQHAYLMPLFKGSGPKSDPNNYRMIAIGSVVAKVLKRLSTSA